MIKTLTSTACVALFVLAAPALAAQTTTGPAAGSVNPPKSGATSATPATPSSRATPSMPGESSTTSATPATPSYPSASTAPSGSSVDTSATAGANAVMPGVSVKDNTGAIIGEVTAVKPDASGKQLATIKMGSDVFTVETSKLAMSGGSATINATQAELKNMLPKK